MENERGREEMENERGREEMGNEKRRERQVEHDGDHHYMVCDSCDISALQIQGGEERE